MMYNEFKERIGENIDYDIFEEYEKMYMAGRMDKDEFCEMVRPYAIARNKTKRLEENCHEALLEFLHITGQMKIEDNLAEVFEELSALQKKYAACRAQIKAAYAERDAQINK